LFFSDYRDELVGLYACLFNAFIYRRENSLGSYRSSCNAVDLS